jgi:hypothetical protein
MAPNYEGPERRNKLDPIQELPVWAQVIIQVIFKYGITAAIALYLVYIVAKNIPDTRLDIHAVKENNEQVLKAQNEMKLELDKLSRQNRLICRMVAKDKEQEDRCYEP